MELDVLYSLPDESTASFTGSQAYEILDDDQQMLIDIEQNIANLERSLSTGKSTPKKCFGFVSSIRSSPGKEQWTSPPTDHPQKVTTKRSSTPTEKSSRFSDRKRSTLKSVRSLIKFGKQRPPKDEEEDEEKFLIHGGDSRQQSDSESVAVSRVGSQESLVSNAESVASLGVIEKNRRSCR